MMFKTIFGVASLFMLIAAAQAASSCAATASVSRRVGQDWTDGTGHKFTIFDITVLNTGNCVITSVQLKFSLPTASLISQAWNLDAFNASATIYSLSGFGNNMQPGSSSSNAGMILQYNNSASVVVSVFNQTCSCGPTPTPAPSNSTAAPTSPPANSTAAPTSPPTNSTSPPVDAALLLKIISAPTELDREKLLTDDQFVFDFMHALTGVTKSAGGKTVAATRTNFPAIIGHGVAMTVGFIEPCGINLPHTHPRATEINFIVSGSFQAGFFQENGARFIGNILQPGMATVFPQGAIHFEINLGCEPAMFVAAFNNEDPGVQTTAQSFFGLPKDVTAVSLNISSIQTVQDLAAHLPANPAVAIQECMRTCGLL